MNVTEKVFAHFGSDLTGKRIAVWGLASQPGTDDISQSPARQLIDQLLAAGAEVVVHDQQALDNVREEYGDWLEYETEKWDAARHADALVVMTPWSQYVGVDPGTLRWYLALPVVFDGCNCLNQQQLSYGDLVYYGVDEAPQPSRDADRQPEIYAIENYREKPLVLQTTG